MAVEKKHCIRDIDNKNIIANAKIFEQLHQKKGVKLTDEVTITNTLYTVQKNKPVTKVEVNGKFSMAYNDVI